MSLTTEDVLLLGLQQRVTAVTKATGELLWSTKVSRGMSGSALVTILADAQRVYVYFSGHLHCLDLATGELLWTNELKGFGFGLAVLCLPGQGSAPDAALVEQVKEAQRVATTGTPAAPIASTS